MVKISVIIPVYNDGEYIQKSIESILNQSLKDIEIICVNDGSSDDSLDILNRISKENDCIKVFNQENQGPAIARNKGIHEAVGEYIGFLDADDFFIDNDALERLYDVAKLNNANMVSGNIKLVDSDGNFSPFKDLDYYRKDSVINPEEYGIPWGFYKSIYKKEFLIDNSIYFPDLVRGEDPVFLAEVLSKVDKIYTVNSDFYAYFYIDGGAKCDTFKIRHAHINHFKLVFEYLSDSRFKNIKESFMHKLFIFIDMMGLEGAKDTLEAIRDVFSDDPGLVNDCENYYYAKFFDNPEVFNSLKLKRRTLISLIIPVYNAEPFLEEALNSVITQNFRDIELICVNDGSTDNSLSILKRFAENDSRIRIIDQENGGCGFARNQALDEAKGEYIYFFDPDDYILPGTFDKLFKNITRNRSDLVLFKIARFNEGESINYSIPGFDLENVFKNKDFNNFTFDYHEIKPYVLNRSFAPWTKLYKKEFLDSYDDFRFPLNIAFDDTPFHIKSILRASKISFIPEFFYHYRFNPNSVNNTSSNGIDIFKICDIVEDFLKDEGFYDEFVNEFKLFKITQITNYLISTGTDEYFNIAKEEFSKMDIDFELNDQLTTQIDLILKSDSFKDYNVKLNYFNNINLLKKENETLKKQNKDLKNKNKKLTKDLKELKKFNSSLLNSTSWRLTEPLRKIKRIKD